MWKRLLSKQNGLWQLSILSCIHGNAPVAHPCLSCIPLPSPDLGSLLTDFQSCGTAHTSLGEEVSARPAYLLPSSLRRTAQQRRAAGGRTPARELAPAATELRACRPAEERTEAAAQQEILVARDKGTAVVTHLGAASPAQESLPWLCLGKTCQHCWKQEFLPWTDTTSDPGSPGCLGTPMACHILAEPRSDHRDTLLPLTCTWLICLTVKSVSSHSKRLGFVVYSLWPILEVQSG